MCIRYDRSTRNATVSVHNRTELRKLRSFLFSLRTLVHFSFLYDMFSQEVGVQVSSSPFCDTNIMEIKRCWEWHRQQSSSQNLRKFQATEMKGYGCCFSSLLTTFSKGDGLENWCTSWEGIPVSFLKSSLPWTITCPKIQLVRGYQILRLQNLMKFFFFFKVLASKKWF